MALEQRAALEAQLAAATEAAAALSAAKADLEASLAQTRAALQSSQDHCDAAEVREILIILRIHDLYLRNHPELDSYKLLSTPPC